MTGTEREGRLTRALARFASRIMLRTARSPLGALWALAHAAIMRSAVAYVRWRAPDASVYLKGSFASAEPVYGVSDIDLVVVAPGEGADRGAVRDRIRRRWRRVFRTRCSPTAGS